MVSDTDGPDAFTLSATECVVEAGSTYQLPVPLTDPEGCFLVYQYTERSGEAIRFMVQADGVRTLLDEVQARCSGRLHVAHASTLMLTWDNTSAWLNRLTVSYSIKVVSDRGVQNTLRARLLHAARHGPLSLAQECLDRGVPADCLDDAGYTSLMLAVLSRQQPMAELLLSHRASVAALDRRGNSALHLASLLAERRTVELLLEAGADPLARNKEGMTAAHIAAFTGSTEAARLLVASSCCLAARDAHGNTPLHLAASAGHAAVLPALLENGDARPGPNARGYSPLGCAVNAGRVEAVEALLRAGALGPAANIEAGEAQEPAVDGGAAELARCVERAALAAHREPTAAHRKAALLLLGFRAGAADGDACVRGLRAAPSANLAPLMVAACEDGGRLPVLRLLQADASPDSTAGGRTALLAAAERGHAAVVSLLMRRGAIDVPHEGVAAAAAANIGVPAARSGKVRSADGAPVAGAMRAAVRGGHTAAVRALIGPRHEGHAGRDALLLAAAAGRTGMLLVLFESGVRLDACDARGRTALHLAAAEGHTMTALTLLRKGCSPAGPDLDGASPVHAALLAGHDATALALLRAAPSEDALELLAAGTSIAAGPARAAP